MGLKICVYAICKNERKFVERWMKSVAEADGIYVLDTGSTDGSQELLRSLGATVGEEKIEPWRFDAARNRALSRVPEDADICVSVDLDEIFHPGWRKALEAAWLPGTKRARYRYTWNFNPDGTEGVVFWSDKMHARHGFQWILPVHEVLKYEEEVYPIVLAEGVQLDHRADDKKSRGQYLPLLELAVEENPENDRCLHYLGREYMFHNQWFKCIETLKRHLALPSSTWADERAASMRFIARACEALSCPLEAEQWLLRAVAEAPHLREPWIDLAIFHYKRNEWEDTTAAALRALQIQDRPKTYICEAQAWGSLPYDLASLGYFHTGRPEESLKMLDQAIERAPADERLRDNRRLIQRTLEKKADAADH